MYDLSGNIILTKRLKIFTIEFQKFFTTDDGNIPHADQSNFIK